MRSASRPGEDGIDLSDVEDVVISHNHDEHTGGLITLRPLRTEYERLGGRFTLHEDAAELATGVWFTGPVPRKCPETNWSTEGLKLHMAAGDVTDNVPEDSALVFSTPEGLVVLTGCGHAGMQPSRRQLPSGVAWTDALR